MSDGGDRDGATGREPAARDAALLCLFALVALALRVYGLYGPVLGGDRVVFREHDPWLHMRLVDTLVNSFPSRLAFDPYGLYPGGQPVEAAPLFDYLVATVALVAGLGAPSARLVDAVGAWLPAVLGALVVVPVYLVARHLFGRAAGLLAAAIIAVQPGQFLRRSALGFADHHVLEWTLTLLALLLLARAVTAARAAGGAGRAAIMPAFAGGVALGWYLLSWTRGVLAVLVLGAWLVVQLVLDHVKGRSSRDVVVVGAAAFGAALVTILPFAASLAGMGQNVPALAGGACAVLLAELLSGRMRAGGLPRAAFPLALAGAAVVLLAALYMAMPPALYAVLTDARRFAPGAGAQTVGEVRPLLFAMGRFSLAPAWEEFGAAGLLGLAGLAMTAVQAAREDAPAKTLLAVWGAAFVAATVGQGRFAYYLAVAFAVLAAGATVRMLRGRPAPFAVAVAFCVAVFPGLVNAARSAGSVDGPSPAWVEALEWMRRSTPEPFGDPGAYLAPTEQPAAGAAFAYPPTAYGVMCWWDYGYWVERIGRRIPAANPTQRGAEAAAAFFTAEGEAAASRVMADGGCRYVVVDRNALATQFGNAPVVAGLFGATAAWAGKDPAAFYEMYYELEPAGGLRPVLLYYPEYYRSMAVRLAAFGGREVVPRDSAWVVTFERRAAAPGVPVRVITGLRRFATSEEAERFAREQPAGTARVVGTSSTASCVPLEALGRYALVHASPADPAGVPEVSIFELVTQ